MEVELAEVTRRVAFAEVTLAEVTLAEMTWSVRVTLLAEVTASVEVTSLEAVAVEADRAGCSARERSIRRSR